MNFSKRTDDEQLTKMKTKTIPLPDAFLSRRSRHGKFQNGPYAGVTARQYGKAIEAFSNGAVKVLSKKETMKGKQQPRDKR